MHEKLLEKFARWFASAAGVYQTVIVVVAISIFEVFHPSADPHAFILMAVLTVYSAVTQPALAYVAQQSAKAESRRDAILAHLEAMVAEEITLDHDALRAIKEVGQ